jgi:tetratricopeptide (TPR) repeat protein
MKARLNVLVVWMAFTLGTLATGVCAAADNTGVFDAANKLYEQGKFTEAVSAYEQLLRSNAISPTLYFNLGNALFKSGQIGRAIATYREVERLTPRDPDVRANLQFARNQVQGPTLRVAWLDRWLGACSLNEWALLAGGAFWTICLLMTAGQWRPQWQQRLRVYAAMMGGAAVVLFACLGMTLRQQSRETVIIIAPEVVVRAGPFQESQSAFTAHDGAEFQILDRKDEWLQVSDGARRSGWLKREQVAVWPTTPNSK